MGRSPEAFCALRYRNKCLHNGMYSLSEYQRKQHEPQAPSPKRWIPMQQWLDVYGITVAKRDNMPPSDNNVTEARAVCGGRQVLLTHDGPGRWVMFVGSKRRRDFQTPFLRHAMATAEQWYGAPKEWTKTRTKNEDHLG